MHASSTIAFTLVFWYDVETKGLDLRKERNPSRPAPLHLYFWYDVEARGLFLRKDRKPTQLCIIANALTVKYKRDTYTRKKIQAKRDAPLAYTRQSRRMSRRQRRAKSANSLNHGFYICFIFVLSDPLELFGGGGRDVSRSNGLTVKHKGDVYYTRAHPQSLSLSLSLSHLSLSISLVLSLSLSLSHTHTLNFLLREKRETLKGEQRAQAPSTFISTLFEVPNPLGLFFWGLVVWSFELHTKWPLN